MREFVDGVAAIVDDTPNASERAARAADLLGPLLGKDDVLGAEHMEPDRNQYRQHVVYASPCGAFSIVALVWLPGQRTPVHDHRCWCVVGVLRGREQEIQYLLDSQGRLTETGITEYERGSVTWLAPPERDIHQVYNVGDSLAISLHIYGADIRAAGTSINRIYPEPCN